MKLATFISKIFEPSILIPVAFIVCSMKIGLSLQESIIWLLVLTSPILAYRIWATKKQGLDWDIRDRKKRIKPIGIMVSYVFIMSCILWYVEPRIFPLVAFFTLWSIGFFLFTAFVTKISGHTGGDALVTGLIITWFGWDWWPVLFIVPLVAWSRVVRQDHTVRQVIAGALYSWTSVCIGSFILL